MEKQVVRRYTKRAWDEMPRDVKGEIGSAVRGVLTPRRWGGYDVEYVDDWESVGLRTLHVGSRMLVEGIDFVVED